METIGKYKILALIALVLYLLPNIFSPSQARFLIHDNMDSNVVWYKNLAESGKFFSGNYEKIERSLGGIDRGCYLSEFNIIIWLYKFFHPLTAYNINIIFIHFFAFFSFYIFSGKYIFKREYEFYTTAVSFLFACLPFWPSGGISIAGQPLLLYSFLNILYSESSKKDWLIIVLFPLYSSFVLANMFFIITLGICFIGYCILKKKIEFPFILALGLFFLMSVIVDYRLFSLQFLDGFESNRSIGTSESALNLKGVIGVGILHFLKGQYHFHSMQWPFIPLLGLLAILFVKNKKNKTGIGILLLSALVISFSYAITKWSFYLELAENIHFPAVQLRFYSLFPVLWYIILGFAIFFLAKINSVFKYIIGLCLLSMFVMSFIPINRKDYYGGDSVEHSFFRTYIDNKNPNFLTFGEYYKTTLFSKISKEIPPGNYYVGCIGLDPEVAQFNNYNTVDGYYPFFSKADLKKFKKIVNKTNEKWSCKRCYLSEKPDNLNYNALKEVNCKYIFSKNKIENANLINVKFFSLNRDTIFVYEIK